MRQKDFPIARALRWQRKRQRTMTSALLLDVDEDLLPRTTQNYEHAVPDVQAIKLRTSQVSSSSFNWNIYRDEECLPNFQLPKQELNQILKMPGWLTGVKRRSRFKCERLIKTSIMLRKSAYTTRWVELEKLFGMRSSVLSEVSLDVFGAFIDDMVSFWKYFASDWCNSGRVFTLRQLIEKLPHLWAASDSLTAPRSKWADQVVYPGINAHINPDTRFSIV